MITALAGIKKIVFDAQAASGAARKRKLKPAVKKLQALQKLFAQSAANLSAECKADYSAFLADLLGRVQRGPV